MSREFRLEIPSCLQDVLGLLAGGRYSPLAGGTNLMVDIRSGRNHPQRIVALENTGELRGIHMDAERVTVGSRTTVSDVLKSRELAVAGPSLVEAAGLFAGQMVRNTATIGGNIACASPAADLVPPLMSLDADVTLRGASGSRTVAMADYYRGHKQEVRRPDELITQVSWRRPAKTSRNSFYKLARRKGDAITVVGVAVTLVASNGVCSKARIALGAVAPCVIRARAAEDMLQGQRPDPALIDAAARQAAAECAPIDDVRASGAYRRHSVRMLARRLLSRAWSDLAAEAGTDV